MLSWLIALHIFRFCQNILFCFARECNNCCYSWWRRGQIITDEMVFLLPKAHLQGRLPPLELVPTNKLSFSLILPALNELTPPLPLPPPPPPIEAAVAADSSTVSDASWKKRQNAKGTNEWKNFVIECWGRVSVWIRLGCPCPPVRNDIVTPRHLLFDVYFSRSSLSGVFQHKIWLLLVSLMTVLCIINVLLFCPFSICLIKQK